MKNSIDCSYDSTKENSHRTTNNEISEIDLLTGKLIISKMDAETKDYAKDVFPKMALVDDDFDDREKAIIESIF